MSTTTDKSESECYKISEVESLTNVKASTLRLWERHGLVVPTRQENNYRVYTKSDLIRIRDIARLRDEKFLSLKAVKAALFQQALRAGSSTAHLSPHSLKGQSTGSSTACDPSQDQTIGWKLKARRREMGMSIRQAAIRTGISPSQISVLENTSTGASIDTLFKLANCYNTSVHELNRVDSKTNDIQVLRGKGRLLPTNIPGLRIEQMGEGFLKMDATKVTLDVGCTSGTEPYSHKGEEFILVLKGVFEITFGGADIKVLEESDSVYFSGSYLHSWRNLGDVPTELLWINSVPQAQKS